MKISENVQVYGINRIVFDKNTVYELEYKDKGFNGMWNRVKSPRNKGTDIGLIDHQRMAKNITAICNTKEYDVGINGDTIHVTTRTRKNRPEVFVLNIGEHDIFPFRLV